MYWSDYFETVDYQNDTKVYKITARYAFGDAVAEKECLTDNASDAPAIFRKWRQEFKDSLKAPAVQEAAYSKC